LFGDSAIFNCRIIRQSAVVNHPTIPNQAITQSSMFSLPLFPLPTVVLFPGVPLPLHIFEPRYRQMVAEALEGDRIIGMVLLRPGYESGYDGAPPVYATGCSGLITDVERLDDGRYDLVLRGLDKFSIQKEELPVIGRLYRSAVVAPIDESVTATARMALKLERLRLQNLLTQHFSGQLDTRLSESMPDENLINALAQYLEFDPVEKLALLECKGPMARCRSMIELLEMKTFLKSQPGDPGTIH
jgi:Lon protease-like protein